MKAHYSAIDRIFHQLALGSQAVRSLSSDINSIVAAPASPEFRDREHIFVAGLARSGTSILLQSLFKTRRFATLTYRHMPFVLAPSVWTLASRKFQVEAVTRERAHGDGVQVDFDSPEAFEEVFWLTVFSKRYVEKGALCSLGLEYFDNTILEKLVQFVSSVVDSDLNGTEGKRYLSKNNNNVLRLSVLKEAFPNAHLLVPFRNPLAQARSLLRQHQHFCALQREDPFALRYMNWLGHHEFGLNHKPFRFLGDDLHEPTDPTRIEYWLTYWSSVYRHLQQHAPEGTIFVDYDALCREPENVLHGLSRKIKLEFSELDPSVFVVRQSNCQAACDSGQLEEAENLYRELVRKSGQHP